MQRGELAMVVGTHTHYSFMRSSECRRIAECCRRLARRQTDARRATLLTSMARAWQTLANQADRYEELPARGEEQRKECSSM